MRVDIAHPGRCRISRRSGDVNAASVDSVPHLYLQSDHPPILRVTVIRHFLFVFLFLSSPARALDLNLEGLVGAVSVEDRVWQRIDLRPRLRYGALEASFDLELFIDGEGKIRDRGWDFSSRRRGLESVLRKIHYIRYGLPEDPARKAYFKVGALDRLTLGNGLIVRDYRNTFGHPGV